MEKKIIQIFPVSQKTFAVYKEDEFPVYYGAVYSNGDVDFVWCCEEGAWDSFSNDKDFIKYRFE